MMQKPRIAPLLLALLLAALSLAGCASPEAAEPEPRITLADAPEILDLSTVLPPAFERLDPDLSGVTKQDLGLGPDASEVESFQADSPFQRILCFLRIIESEEGQRQTSLTMYDETEMRAFMARYLDLVATNIRGSLVDPQIQVSYPDVAAGAVLAEGKIEAPSFTLEAGMLLFRSSDRRVFVYVQSWYVSQARESATAIAGKIEERIKNFDG